MTERRLAHVDITDRGDGKYLRWDAGDGVHVYEVPSATVAEVLDLPTAEMDDTKVIAPDGAGGIEARAPAYPALTTANAQQAGDVALSATTYTTLTSFSLGAGTWSIWGVAVFHTVGAVSPQYAQLWDGSAQLGQVAAMNPNVGGAEYHAVPVFAGGVVLASPTTIYLRGYSDQATTAKGSTALGVGGGSKMHAIRTA